MEKDIKKINTSPKTLKEACETISQLVDIIIDLKKENDSLLEQLNNNSNNSSMPPSKDLKKKKKSKPKSKRKQGAQPGHKANHRAVVPENELDAVVDCKPATNCGYGGVIGINKKFRKHQVFEIPAPKFEVTEYRLYKGCCNLCKKSYSGGLPSGVSFKGFGPRAHAMVGLLTIAPPTNL